MSGHHPSFSQREKEGLSQGHARGKKEASNAFVHTALQQGPFCLFNGFCW
jgi:hypothetical protein